MKLIFSKSNLEPPSTWSTRLRQLFGSRSTGLLVVVLCVFLPFGLIWDANNPTPSRPAASLIGALAVACTLDGLEAACYGEDEAELEGEEKVAPINAVEIGGAVATRAFCFSTLLLAFSSAPFPALGLLPVGMVLGRATELVAIWYLVSSLTSWNSKDSNTPPVLASSLNLGRHTHALHGGHR
jgi:hypothetical protein